MLAVIRDGVPIVQVAHRFDVSQSFGEGKVASVRFYLGSGPGRVDVDGPDSANQA